MTRRFSRSAVRRTLPSRRGRAGLATALASASLAFAALSVAAAVDPPQARAHGPIVCGQRDAIIEHLEERFDETRVVVALDSRGRLVEILAGESGSWTLLVTTPDGRSCLAGSGTAFSILPAEGGDEPLA